MKRQNKDQKIMKVKKRKASLKKSSIKGKINSLVFGIIGIMLILLFILGFQCQTAHCGRCEQHFIVGAFTSPTVRFGR